VPGDNSVDLFTNDLGLVVITDPATGQLEGFNLVAGGGMGEQSRGRAERLRVQLREL
jgi:sulfite reductase beta subunit-like hemoprotein